MAVETQNMLCGGINTDNLFESTCFYLKLVESTFYYLKIS